MKKLLLISMLFMFGCSDSPAYIYVADSTEQPYVIVKEMKIITAHIPDRYEKNLGPIQVYYLSKAPGYSNKLKIYIPKKWELGWEAGDKIILVSSKEYEKLHDIILSLEKGERPRFNRRLENQLNARVEDIESGKAEPTNLDGIW